MQITQFSGNRTSKMKFLIVLALAAVVYADVADQTAQVLKFDSEVNPDSYSYAYETSNGIVASEQGVVNNPNSENAALAVQGQFSYPGEDGRPVQLNYVADENGFQPQGAHLPQPPPIPEAILRAIAYNEAHPSAEDKFQQGPARAFPAPPPRVPAPAPPARFPAPSPGRFPSPSRSSNFGAKPFGRF